MQNNMRLPAFFIILTWAALVFSEMPSAYGSINNAIISWGDICFVYGPGTDTALDSPEAIARVMKRWKARGYTGVYWRSDLGDYDPNEIIRYHGSPLEPMIDLGIRRGVEDTAAKFCVLQAARQAAEAEGLQFWVYHPTIYSDGASPTVGQPGYMPWSFQHRYTHDHPEVLTIDRTGKVQHLVREYAYPGARADKIYEYVHMARAFGIKNFLISMRTEAAQTEPGPVKADQYGFNQPVVDAMLAQYNVNILTDPRFDINDPAWNTTDPMVQNWHRLRGGYLTQLYRELRQALNAVNPNIRLAIQVPGDYAGPDLGNWVLDWRTWINEGLVNEIVQPVTLQAGWDSTLNKGYLCDILHGIGVLPISTFRNHINNSPHPETKLIQAGAYEKFGTNPLPPEADGWQTFWAYEAFDVAWFNRWQQWNRDLEDFGYIKFIEQNFDGFQVNSSGYTGAEGDARYHPELRACPGAWSILGDGSDYKPVVQNTVSRSGNAMKITKASDASGGLYAVHQGGIDHDMPPQSFQMRVDNLITSGTCTFEFWLYRAEAASSLSIFLQYNHYTDTGLNLGINIQGGNSLATVQLWQNGRWINSNPIYQMPVGQWQKFTVEINVDAKTYTAYAGSNREIALRPFPITYTTSTNCFNRVIFVPSGSVASTCYLDDVCWKWTPAMHYSKARTNTWLADSAENHPAGTNVNNTSADIGAPLKLSPSSASGFFADKVLSFGDGYQCLAATAGSGAYLYSGDTAKLQLNPLHKVIVDFDIFLRKNYQSIISLQENHTGNPAVAINPNGKWNCWNATQYTTTDVNVAYDLWNHVQMVLDNSARNYKVIVQPCGSLPKLVGTYSFDAAALANDQVFLVIKPQGTNGQITYVDNLRITYGPDCPTGDLNGDCAVNVEDFAKLALNWLDFAPVGDLNSDKFVNFEDLQEFAIHWLESK